MFAKLLIANRGEIACRIARTARRLGIGTVAVFSDADAGALHAKSCDEAVRIGPPPARESYLDIEAILAAARATGADAIHPGYGFLSENARFAEAVEAAGLVFVGPKPASIRAMGDKAESRRRMAAAGVPVVPGYDGEDQSDARLLAEAESIGRPLMIKASAGGGGKGMRVVRAGDDFAAALASARREAESAFGDGRVILERYVDRPRHIEIQVFGDSHGNLVHLFERDCSLQRRHQKVLEEAPAPHLPDATRAAMAETALAAARAIDYRGAGTVEMLLGGDGRFYFMEMNTRLQVEHPVTEAITGQDLVEWQLTVAAGRPLPLRQDEIRIDGHAVEVRLYAEDPFADDRPQTGPLDRLVFPQTGPGGRIDTGVEAGDSISPFYDPMIAKLICHGPDRKAALAGLRRMLAGTVIAPLVTNQPLLMAIAADPAVGEGGMDTGFIPQNRDSLLAPPVASAPLLAAAALAARGDRDSGERDRESPWRQADGFRLNAEAVERFAWRLGDAPVEARLAGGGESLALLQDGLRLPITAVDSRDGRLDFVLAGVRHSYRHLRLKDGLQLQDDRMVARLLNPPDPGQAGDAAPADDRIAAPMPGRITAVLVAPGDSVRRGQRLVTMEAMKMEHALVAPADAVVETITVAAGALVGEGQLLVRLAIGAAEAA